MAFTTRRSSAPLRTNLPSGSWEVLDLEPAFTSEGWDEFVMHLAGWFPGTSTEQVPVPFIIGDALAVPGNFFIARIGPVREWGGGVYQVDILGQGIRDGGRPTKVRVGGRGEIVAAENVNGHPRAEVTVHTPTFEEQYILVSGSPPTSTVGSEVMGPHGPGASFPTTPANPWTLIANPTWHAPSGWVHESCEAEEIEGTGIWLIQNTYRYQFEYTP